MLGVYWGDWTLHELVIAWNGRMRAQWGMTSSQMALLANVNRDPKKTRPFHPNDFNPLAEQRETSSRIPLTTDNIQLLKSFVKG